MASVRSCKKLPPCLTKPVRTGSKMDPPLAKAKQISDCGSASMIMCLRKGGKQKTGVRRQWRERSEKM